MAGEVPQKAPGQGAEAADAEQERAATVEAVRAFFNPRSVAVIGASRTRGTIGGELFHNLLSYGFAGPVYPVNPAADVVEDVPAYPSVEAVPGPVDLALIAVPAPRVMQVVEECGRKGVRALVIVSAGFAETGQEGRTRQLELVQRCRALGMRLIGPNCMGIVNTDPAVRLDAIFAPQAPPPGNVAFSSQSGGLGLAVIDYAHSLGLGLSTFASLGNKADISTNDLLSYWESDPRTAVVLLYVESFGNPRKFSRIARRVGRSKPIAVVKSGRSPAGARAVSSHTGALLAASDVTVDALFRQAGVIRSDTLEQLFDVAALLAHQPPPRGRRVGILSNAGGPAILCADACQAEGLEVTPLSGASQARLRDFLPPQATVANPVDMIASASAQHYRRAIPILAADPNIDALVVIFIPPLSTPASQLAQAIADGARELAGQKPILTVFMSARGAPPELRGADVRVPCYAFPEAAAIALAQAVRYGEWRGQPLSVPPVFEDIRREEAAALVEAALRRGGGWLAPDVVRALLTCYGLPMVEERTVTGVGQVRQAAQDLGGELALKAWAPGLVHKTDVGAVRLHLTGVEVVASAAAEMAQALQARGYEPAGFQVQRMAPPGAEMIVGVVHDPLFGPVVACGAGGVLVELLGDVAVRLAPLTHADVSAMLRSLKSYPLLTGFRGAPARDVGALEDAVLRIGALAEDFPQVAELDCNPIIVHQRGASIADARVRVAAPEPPPASGARRAPPA